MKFLSICNKKGGVGKTTLCKNIAYKLALENKKVLLLDLENTLNHFCRKTKKLFLN